VNTNSKKVPIFAPANRKISNANQCNRGVVQLASILAWGASGRPFESGHSDKRAAEKSAAFFVLFWLAKTAQKKDTLADVLFHCH